MFKEESDERRERCPRSTGFLCLFGLWESIKELCKIGSDLPGMRVDVHNVGKKKTKILTRMPIFLDSF